MEYLSAENIWNADDLQEADLIVPEWPQNGQPGKVRVRGLDLEQMASLADRCSRRNPATGQDIIDRELSVILTVVYGMVEPKLTEADAAKLKKKSANAVTRIVQAINALGPTAGAIENATKSDAAQRDDPLSVFTGAGTG